MRPGLTGLAQIRFRSAAPWSVRIEGDLEYVENVSLLTDLRVLLGTIPAVLCASGQSIGETAAMIDDIGPGPSPDTAHDHRDPGSEFEYPTHDQLDAGGCAFNGSALRSKP